MDCMGESIDFLWDFMLGILLPAYRAFVVVSCSMGEGGGILLFFCDSGDTVVGGTVRNDIVLNMNVFYGDLWRFFLSDELAACPIISSARSEALFSASSLRCAYR